jgi:hypothetical protein
MIVRFQGRGGEGSTFDVDQGLIAFRGSHQRNNC